MSACSVAMHCPVCGAPAELRAVLTDMGFAVARATMLAHIAEDHGVDPDEAFDCVEALDWKATEAKA